MNVCEIFAVTEDVDRQLVVQQDLISQHGVIWPLHKCKLTIGLSARLLAAGCIVTVAVVACCRLLIILLFWTVWGNMPGLVTIVTDHPRHVASAHVGHYYLLIVAANVGESQPRIVKPDILRYHLGWASLHDAVGVVHGRRLYVVSVQEGVAQVMTIPLVVVICGVDKQRCKVLIFCRRPVVVVWSCSSCSGSNILRQRVIVQGGAHFFEHFHLSGELLVVRLQGLVAHLLHCVQFCFGIDECLAKLCVTRLMRVHQALDESQ